MPPEMAPLNPQYRTSARGAWRMALCASCRLVRRNIVRGRVTQMPPFDARRGFDH